MINLIRPTYLCLLSLAIVFSFFLSCQEKPKKQAATIAIPAPPIKRITAELYGLDVTERKLVQNTFKRNQFLADVLIPHDVEPTKIHSMGIKSKEVFDVRKMRAGQPFTLVKNEEDKVEYFVYEKNRADYVVFDLRDSVHIYEGTKPVEKKIKTCAGYIASSLYETILEQNVHPTLAYELENVYGWTVDFFHLQKGDYFKVIYEEKFVDGESLGVGEILGAHFQHLEKDLFAVAFEQDGHLDYFDEEGNSLRKEFLRAPLKYTRISSRFSYRRYHPVLKRYKAHLGTDYAAPYGTPIYSVGDGVISKKGYTRGNGNYVKVKHNSTYSTQYLHMRSFAKGMKKGVFVKQGQVIGYVGSTGLATGPHVCFRFWKNGRQVNPKLIDAPPAEPIKDENVDAYQIALVKMLERLKKIEEPQAPALVIEAG